MVTGIAALVAMPTVLGALPVGSADRAAAQLLTRVHRSTTTPYAGYAESTGGLALPATDQLSSVGDLLGGHTRTRVWWRAADDWRVDTLGPSGEEDVHRAGSGVWTWDYESDRATFSRADPAGTVRLPVAADTTPADLGRRLLADARPGEVSALAPRRIAGRQADGLRLRPQDPLTSIERVDVWADRSTGIPLRVDVFGAGSTVPAMSTTFLDFSAERPSAAETDFAPPASARVRLGDRFDLVRLITYLAGPLPPATLAGMPREDLLGAGSAIGVYGRGVTELVAAPLPWREADALRRQLATAPGVTSGPAGLSLAIGPLGLLLTGGDASGRSWLLTGTVTLPALVRAATEIASTAESADTAESAHTGGASAQTGGASPRAGAS